MKNKITIFLIIAMLGLEIMPLFTAKAQCDPKDPDCVTSGEWDYGTGGTETSPSTHDLYNMTPHISEPDLTDSVSSYNIVKGDVLACMTMLSQDLGEVISKVTKFIGGIINKGLGFITGGLLGGGDSGLEQTISIGGTDTKAACMQWLKDKKSALQAQKGQITKMLLGYAAKTFMDHLVYSTVDWISGRTTGEPQFVTNWQAFFNDVADEAFGRFIENSPFSELCEPFRFQVRATTRLPGRPPFPTCTLTQVLSNLEYFYSDFSNGGWLVFEQSFYPWNTSDGAWLMTQEALEYELAQAQMEAEKKTQTGYKPIEDCVYKIKNYITGDTECWDSIISAPSQTVSDVASKAVTAQIDKTESYFLTSADLSNYATMIGQALITRLIKSAKEELIGGKWYGKGLLDLPEKGDEGPSLNLRYSCKNYDGMGSCEYDANGSYTSLESCQAACSKNQYRWGCNTETGICEYQASGPYTDFTTCSNACSESTSTPTTTSMFWTCDPSIGECVEDENGDFRSLQGCLKMCSYKEPGKEVPSY